MKLRGKFTAAFLASGLIPLVLATLFVQVIAERALNDINARVAVELQQNATDQLRSLLDAKKAQILTYINTLSNEALVISHERLFIQSALEMSTAFESFRFEAGEDDTEHAANLAALQAYYAGEFAPKYTESYAGESFDAAAYVAQLSENAISLQHAYLVRNPDAYAEHERLDKADVTTRYTMIHERGQPFWRRTARKLGFDDVFIVNAGTSEIVYSLKKRVDFGTRLNEGTLGESHAAVAYRKALDSDDPEAVFFTDYKNYLPALGEPLAFISTPIFEGEQKVAVAMFSINLDQINSIMNAPLSMGQTGEMLLVGPDSVRRSDYTFPETPADTVKHSLMQPELARVEMEPVYRALNQRETGTTVAKDMRGKEALIAYAPLNMMGVPWAVLAKVETAEAFGTVAGMMETGESATRRMLFLSNILVLLAAVVLTLVAFLVARSIAKPVRSTVAILRNMAQGEGDVRQRLDVKTNDEMGELARWFNTFMDKIQQVYHALEGEIVERQRAQASVEQSQQYFKTLIENAPDVIMVIDAALTVQYLSPAFERTFGLTKAEVLGKRLTQFVHPADYGAVYERIQESAATPGHPLTMEYRLHHQDGDWREVEMVVTHYVQDEKIEGIVLNIRDLTERKKADGVLSAYYQTLEHDVAERTMQLQQHRDDLARALDKLKATQESLILNEKMASLGALTAGIAHEIKNPLNFVNNFAELTVELTGELAEELERARACMGEAQAALLESLLNDVRQNSEKILSHGKRADTIIRNMLLHSRNKSSGFELTDLNALLREYSSLAFHGLRARNTGFNVDVRLELDPAMPTTHVIAQDMARVFLNILNNACYAAYQRSAAEETGFRPTVLVQSTNRDETVEIRIRDNGMGMGADTLKDIFNPFFTTKPAGEGTGLGLSISYDIVVTEHSGNLTVDSEPGVFTEFTIVLPKRGLVEPKESSA